MGAIFEVLVGAIVEPLLAVVGYVLLTLLVYAIGLPLLCAVSTPVMLMMVCFGPGTCGDKVASGYKGVWKAGTSFGGPGSL